MSNYVSQCFWHSVVEEINEETFRKCSTCKHVYQKEADLRREAFALETPEYDDNGKIVEGFSKQTWPDDTKTEDIKWCPFCGVQFSEPSNEEFSSSS